MRESETAQHRLYDHDYIICKDNYITNRKDMVNKFKNFLDKFNDISLLADLMGHESIETTRIYLRRTASEQQAIVDKIITW